MKLTVGTEVLKRLVAKAVKGARGDKTNPLTSLICLKLESGILTLITTDGTNYLYVKEECACDDFYTVVEIERFSKLVSKLTCDTVTLTAAENFLEVQGNGKYRIEIPLDEGKPIVYPDPIAELELVSSDAKEINASDIKTALNTCKSSLTLTCEIPCYRGCYIGDLVAATNNSTVSLYSAELLDVAVLVSPRMVELLSLTAAKTISVYLVGERIVWASSDCVVYGPLMEDLEDYPIEAIKNYAVQNMEGSCKVEKAQLLSALDRVDLFIGVYDNNTAKLTFTDKGINIESAQLTGAETVSYLSTAAFKSFTGLIDVDQFVKLIKAYPGNEIEIQYGSSKAMKLVAEKVLFVIAWIVE